ncbi:MAG: hypothetical protein ACR2JE_15700 [Acidobacteriaceae bacterium]
MTDTPSTSRTGEAVKGGSTETPGTGNRASLLIRLWTLPRAELNPAARSWHEESGEVAMLADLVSACRGRLADGYKPQLTAEFSDLPAALIAAKRMQRAMLGFASHQPRSRAAAAIGVFSRLGNTSSGATAREEMQTAGTLMSAATAGQILLTQAAYLEIMRLLPQTARGISSVRLGTTTGGPALKAYELVWEEPEVYVRLRKLVEGMEWAHATASHRSEQTTKRIADPQLSAGAGASGTGSAEASPQFAAETAAPARVWRRTWAVLGVAAAALISATVLLTTKLDTGHFEPLRRGPSPTIAKPPAVNPNPGPASPERPNPISVAGDGEKPPTAKSPEDRNGTKNTSGEQTKREISREISKEPMTEPQPAQPPRPAPVRAGREPVEGFYRRDIPGLLEKADRDGGNGKYGSAKYWYGIVLQLDPGNAKARQELSRVVKAEELDQQ